MTNARTLLFFVVAMVTACHGDSSDAPAGNPVPRPRVTIAVKHGPTPQELTAGMVEAAALGKSQQLVALKFELLQRPAVGQVLEIAIALLPQFSAGPVSIEMTASDGLQPAADSPRNDIPWVEPAQVYRHSIKLTPTTEGVLILGLTVTLQHDGSSESQAFSLPIIVGR